MLGVLEKLPCLNERSYITLSLLSNQNLTYLLSSYKIKRLEP